MHVITIPLLEGTITTDIRIRGGGEVDCHPFIPDDELMCFDNFFKEAVKLQNCLPYFPFCEFCWLLDCYWRTVGRNSMNLLCRTKLKKNKLWLKKINNVFNTFQSLWEISWMQIRILHLYSANRWILMNFA